MSTINWIAKSGVWGGNWADPAHWSLGSIPDITSDVNVGANTDPQGYVVQLNDTRAVHSLTLGGLATLNLTSHLTVATTLTVNSGLLALQSGAVLSGGTLAVPYGYNRGQLISQGGRLDGVTVTGAANFSRAPSAGTGVVTNTLVVTNGLTIAQSGTLIGQNLSLLAVGSETINGGQLAAFAPSQAGTSLAVTAVGFGSAATVTLGSALQLALYAGSRTTLSAIGASQLINAGTITSNGGAITLSIGGSNFKNLGQIQLISYTTATVTSANFSNAGGINLAAQSAYTTFKDGPVFAINSAAAQNSGVISIGKYATLSETGGVLGNTGTISVSAGQFAVSGGTLVNSGLISLDNYSALSVAGGALNNAGGTIVLGSGSLLSFANNVFSGDKGTLIYQGGAIGLGGSVSTSQIATLASQFSGGTLALTGTLSNAGNFTAPFGVGFSVAGGTIGQTTVRDKGLIRYLAGPVATGANIATLSGVTYLGTLSLGNDNAVTLTAGFTLKASNGSTGGAIAISGTNSALNLNTQLTLNSSTVSMNGGIINVGSSSFQTTLTLGTGSVLQVGPGADSLIALGESFAVGGLASKLDNQGSIVANGVGASLTIGSISFSARGVLTNSGKMTLTNGAQIDANVGAFFNSGTVSVSGTSSLLSINIGPCSNTGTMIATAGGQIVLGFLNSPGFSNAGLIKLDGGTLSLQGDATSASLTGIACTNGGLVSVAARLSVQGSLTLSSAAGSLVLGAATEGVISGGTLIDVTGGGLQGQGGTLSNLSFRGTLALAQAGQQLSLTNVALAGVSGGRATIIVASGTSLSAETIDNANISLGGTGIGTATLMGRTYYNFGSLLLGRATSLSISGANASVGVGHFGGTLTALGRITDQRAGSTLRLVGPIINGGTIAVSNGATLNLSGASQFTNNSTVTVNRATLVLGAQSLSLAQGFTLTQSQVVLGGLLDLNFATFTVGQTLGGRVSALNGGLSNGTVIDVSGKMKILGGFGLNNATWQGTLTAGTGAYIFVSRTSFTGASGSGTGVINLTAAGASLGGGFANGPQAATDSVQVLLGNATLASQVQMPVISADATLIQTTGLATIGGRAPNGEGEPGDKRLTRNDGNWSISGSAQTLLQLSSNFDNAGTISLAGNAAVNGWGDLQDGYTGAMTNDGTISLAGHAVLTTHLTAITNNGQISIADQASLAIDPSVYFTAPDGLTDFTNEGSISLSGGTIAALTAGGTYPLVALENDFGANISGFGTIADDVNNDGTILASGGTLNITGDLSGFGTLAVGNGAACTLAGAVSSDETVSLAAGNGFLQLQPMSFAGTLDGFGLGDTLRLTGVSLSGAAISGSTLVLQLSGGGTIALATSNIDSKDTLLVSAAGTDTLLSFTAAGHAAPPSSSPAVPPTPAAAGGSAAHAGGTSHVAAGLVHDWTSHGLASWLPPA